MDSSFQELNESSLKELLRSFEPPQLIECLESNGHIESDTLKPPTGGRKESSIYAMRNFHNWVKLLLISNSIQLYKKNNTRQKTISLLDIAEWNKSGVDYVHGFDISKNSVQEANDRLSVFKNNRMKKVILEVGDATDPKKVITDKFQIVSCQFAFHYFTDSVETLRNVFKLVSNTLVSGGFFIGTTINKDKLLELFRCTKKTTVKRTLFKIHRDFKALQRPKPFGQEYTFTILDTQDQGNYFNTIPESTEYLVDFQKLNEIALEYSLVPFTQNFFESYKSEGNNTNFAEIRNCKLPNVQPFDEILPRWIPQKGTPSLNENEMELNSLYCTFVYQKR